MKKEPSNFLTSWDIKSMCRQEQFQNKYGGLEKIKNR